MRFIGEKEGIENIYGYEIYTPQNKLKILDMVVETANGYCIDFEFHKSRTTEDIILRNIQYVVGFRRDSKKLIKPYNPYRHIHTRRRKRRNVKGGKYGKPIFRRI
ncbi:hypothetical protein [Methanobrevibacter sp.]|uniref:hypothetical protein n=1 Tax=Methanobrevibacter sp. TaxID=66852 RepID=UPI00386F7AD5